MPEFPGLVLRQRVAAENDHRRRVRRDLPLHCFDELSWSTVSEPRINDETIDVLPVQYHERFLSADGLYELDIISADSSADRPPPA